MKTKGILIIMALTLTLGIVGCGQDKEDASKTATTQKNSSDSTATSQKESSESEIIKQDEKTLIDLGGKQTKELKKLVEKYGVKTSYNPSKNASAQMAFSKDENDCVERAKGYCISSSENFTPNYGGICSYFIQYHSYIRDEEPSFFTQISLHYTEKEEFKLEDFEAFKEIMKVFYGDKYDVGALENRIQKHVNGDKSVSNSDVGPYQESLIGGIKGSANSKGITKLTCEIRLRK